MTIAIKINCDRIDKARLFKGTKGRYLDVVLIDNKDGRDQYGNDGMAVQGVSAEERKAGVKGPILGNWKRLGQQTAQQPPPPQDDAPPAPWEDRASTPAPDGKANGEESAHDGGGDNLPF